MLELALTVAQYKAATKPFPAGTAVSVIDSGAALSALTPAEIAAMSQAGVLKLGSTNGSFSLTIAQAQALGALQLQASDHVVLSDTGTRLSGLSASEIAALAAKGMAGVDAIDGSLTLTASQAVALGPMILADADAVTLADTGAHLSALTAAQLAALSLG
jgi:hypothetical protein